MGIKASDTRAIFFDKVKVPVTDRLGDVGQGFHIALEVLNSGRLGLASASARGTRHVMRLALAYAKEREQFGKPIGSFEMVQRKIAMAAVDCYALDSAAMVASGMVDRGGIDFSLETAACKVFGSELAFRTANDALQIAGGIGYSKEYPYEQAVRDARINLIFEGTNEILRALIALMGMQEPAERLKSLGKAFKDPIHSLGAIGDYLKGRAKRTITKPHFSRVHESLEHEGGARLDAGAQPRARRRGGGHEVRKGDSRHAVPSGTHGERRDRHLSRDGRVVENDVGRSHAAEREGSSADAHIDCARIFVPMAYRRARRSIRGLRRNQDARLKSVAERSMETGELGPEAPADER